MSEVIKRINGSVSISKDGGDFEPAIDCPECNGWGECEYEIAVPMSFTNPYGYLDTITATCEMCGGSGVLEIEDDNDE